MSSTNRANTEISPRAALLSIIVLVLLLTGTVIGVMKMMNGGSATPPESVIHRSAKPVVAQSADDSKASSDSDYSIIATRNLFRPLEKPSPPPPPPPPPKVEGKKPTGPIKPAMPPGPRLAYTGMVELPYGSYILLENLETKEAVYTRVGEEAFGCKVVQATPDAVTLDQRGTSMLLPLGANKVEEVSAPPKAETPTTNPAPAEGQNTAQPGTNADQSARFRPGGFNMNGNQSGRFRQNGSDQNNSEMPRRFRR